MRRHPLSTCPLSPCPFLADFLLPYPTHNRRVKALWQTAPLRIVHRTFRRMTVRHKYIHTYIHAHIYITCCISESYFSESFEQKTLSLKSKSDFGHLAGWKLGGLIAKSNDDLRQEVRAHTYSVHTYIHAYIYTCYLHMHFLSIHTLLHTHKFNNFHTIVMYSS